VPNAAGVRNAWVTRSAASNRANSNPPGNPGGATTSVPAAPNANRYSSIAASKLGEENPNTRDPGPVAHRSRNSAAKSSSPRWVTTTPLGTPLDPEV